MIETPLCTFYPVFFYLMVYLPYHQKQFDDRFSGYRIFVKEKISRRATVYYIPENDWLTGHLPNTLAR